ncbi:MAG TPA: Asp-tRNA(Asn)/Glu-tRNA(Gln) amidotransferase subunit GatC [Thermoanaerobaculia bacterium]|nr:Asp-tRNA(Asn)/Glu-tRNA(Gln) amidotransferase subunit GatC [Thermoanaerobaculia bacterium]
MKIDRIEAKRIADLAHLEFDEAGLERMAGEMTKILSYIDQLREVDITGFEDVAASEQTPLREDVPCPPVDRHSIAANAPAFSEDGHFIVPKVIGD